MFTELEVKLYFSFYITDGGIPGDIATLKEECIMKFVCQMLVTNYSIPSTAEGLTSSKLLHLLNKKSLSSNKKYASASIYNNNGKYRHRNQSTVLPGTYSLYEWGEAIKLILE